jgi:hypothetical protein
VGRGNAMELILTALIPKVVLKRHSEIITDSDKDIEGINV